MTLVEDEYRAERNAKERNAMTMSDNFVTFMRDGDTHYIHERDHDRIVTALKAENEAFERVIERQNATVCKLAAQNERLIRMLAEEKTLYQPYERGYKEDVADKITRIRQEIETVTPLSLGATKE